MKTKEIAFTLPVIIVLYEFMFFKGKLKNRILRLLPLLLTLFIIPLSYLGANKSAGDLLSDVSEATRLQTAMSRPDYLFTEFRVIVTYIRLLFLPVNQNLDYDYPIYNYFLNPNVFLSFVFLLSVFGLAVYLFYYSRQHPPQSLPTGQAGPLDKGGIKGGCSRFTVHSSPITDYALRITAFGIFWFFITLSVESSVIPIEDVIFEHRVYLPGIGLIIAFISAVFYLFIRFTPRLSLAACCLLLTTSVVMFSIAAFQRNAVWKDEISLWTDVVNKSPSKARAYNNLGLAYKSKGWIDKSIEKFQIALMLKPDFVDVHISLGFIYFYYKGWIDKAIEHYQLALKFEPNNAKIHLNLAIAYKAKGWTDRAEEHSIEARRLNPYLF